MALIDYILHKPSYGWQDEKGEVIVPTTKQLFKEAFSRFNIVKDK
jgi:stearoyl-CoA desaturase (delta-9 desaturase)